MCGFNSSYSKPIWRLFGFWGKNQFGHDSSGLPGRGFFFDLWHVPFQQKKYIAVFGTKIGPNHFVVKTSSVMIPPVCLAGAAVFF